MSRLRSAFLLIIAGLLLGPPISAANRQTIKLATLIPTGSVWHKTLQSMGAEWKDSTGGRIQLRIYPGGD